MTPFGAGLYLLLWLNLSLSGVGWSMGLNQGAGPAPLLSLLTGFALFCGFVHSRRPRRWIRALRLLSAAVALLLFIPRVLEGDLLGGMLLLVCFTMLALCFTLSQPREVFMLLLASLGPVLFGAGLYPQAGFRLLLSAWLLSAVLVLMQLQLARVRQRVDGFSGSGAWLAALPVSIAILALALLLYWLLPQPPAPYYALVPVGTDEPYGDPRWEARATADERPHRGAGGNEAGSGTGTGPGPAAEPEPQLNLFAGAPEDPPRRLLSVTSDEPVHLRTRVFDQFNGDSWSRSPAPARYVRLRDGLFERAPTGSSAPVRHTIEVLAELDQALPLAPVPHRIEIPSRVLRLDARGAIELPQPLRPGLRYRVKSSGSTLQDHRVSMEAAKLPGYRSLPAGSESICTLAGTIGGGREPLAAARAIERYLVETFPTPPPGAPPAERDLTKALYDSGRLTEGQRLSAFALMLRCLDTPTRMVEGYRSNLRHPLSGQIEVTTDHGIVWPEVWQARHGWIAFAVTDRPDPLGEPGWLENAERFLLLRLRLAETGPLERLALETALVLVRLLLELKLLLASHPLPAALAGLLVLLLLGLAWLFRRRIGDGLQDWQLRRRLRHDPERAALHLYAALERWLHRRRLPRDRHETASEYGRRLGDGEPALRAALIPVLKAFNDCRYGPPGHSALAPDEALLHWRRIRRLADEIDWL